MLFIYFFFSIAVFFLPFSPSFHDLSIVQRIIIPEILEDEWFKKDYKPPVFDENYDTNLDDVEAVFKDSEVS